MAKSALLILSIMLFLAAAPAAQTSFSGSDTRTLVPMNANDEMRYRYGIAKHANGNDRVVIDSRARSKCDLDIGSDMEFAWLYHKNQTIFLYSVKAKKLAYEKPGGRLTARFSIFVRVRNATKKIDGGFEDVVTDLARARDLGTNFNRRIVYRKIVDLPPGSYRADVTVRDINRGCHDLSAKALTVPDNPLPSSRVFVFGRDPFSGISPFLSTLVLGRPLNMFDKDPAALHAPYARWMVPDTGGEFRQGETIAVWYCLSIPRLRDCSTSSPCQMNPDEVEYIIENADGKKIMAFAQDWKENGSDPAPRVMATFSTDSFAPGKYRIVVTVKQKSSGMSFSQNDVFRIIKRSVVPQNESPAVMVSTASTEADYKRWLARDVAYLITDDERKAFLKLKTNEKREKFIEDFWFRRDPTPGTEKNEFQTAYYERIAYANEHFRSGIAGWLTDRGKTLIVWGFPYSREMGSTTAYGTIIGYQRWLYKTPPPAAGVSGPVERIFIDPTESNEYRLLKPEEYKDFPGLFPPYPR